MRRLVNERASISEKGRRGAIKREKLGALHIRY
jgi:hypothetical protein